ncbi:MAG TPA: helix-turn-helix domain-containing protein, partial [Chloroflexota bacterium]|nr:helix-turn-helix domain-containing protein [Chloroflexota bacterium]
MQVVEENGTRPERPVGQAREKLLAAVIGYAAAHGLSDLSLRDVAAAIGTSHRMLIYHFGSREGLLVAVVKAVEESSRALLAELAADPSRSLADVMLDLWERIADPTLWPAERLFFEIYALALQRRPGTAGFLDDIVDSWVEPVVEYARRRGMDPEAARVDARLGVAMSRGLLLDLLATGDRAAVDACVRRYRAQYEALAALERRGQREEATAPERSSARPTPRERPRAAAGGRRGGR